MDALTALQNKISSRNRYSIIKRIKLDWLLYKGENSKAIDELVSMIEKKEHLGKDYLYEIKKLIDMKVYKEAQVYLESMLEYKHKTEQLGEIYYLLARCLHGQGYVEEALKHIECALQLQPYNSSFFNLQADCFLELGEWEKATNCLNQSLRSSPTDAESIYRLGTIYQFHGEYSEALNCFNGCCKLKPFNPDYWEMKGEMLLKNNLVNAAASCFHKAVKYGGRVQIFIRLAYCYAKSGQLKKSQKLLQRVLKNDPDDYDALCNLAAVYHKLDKSDQAYKLLQKAYVLNCNDPLLLNNFGYISHSLGRNRKAIELLNKALMTNPDDIVALYNLGVCYAKTGQFEEARNVLEHLTSLDKGNKNAWILLGNVCEQLYDYNSAVDCFNISLGLAN